MADLTKTKITAQAFYELYEETTEQIELIGGEVIMSPAAKDIHGEVVIELVLLIGYFVKANKLGHLRTAPNDVHFSEEDVVQPDIHFISYENTGCKKEDDGYWHGAPDLIIEVLSPGTTRLDRVKKYQLYQNYGVQEYWIVDPIEKFIEVYGLVSGVYQRQGAYTEKDTLTSNVLAGFSTDLSLVFLY